MIYANILNYSDNSKYYAKKKGGVYPPLTFYISMNVIVFKVGKAISPLLSVG